LPEQINELERESGLLEEQFHPYSNPEEEEDEHDSMSSEEEMSSSDLEDFLSQFVLIKTPYGYILVRAPPSGEMIRMRRSKQQV